ncbi:MAG: hypothetical protein P8Y02_05755 [Deinococcales bacterium]
MRRVATTLVLLLAPLAAQAASPIAESSPHGVMMLQALRTLGAWVVPCTPLAAQLGTPGGEVTCAEVPGSMYGFFREAVHGRLFEYLTRKTLTVVDDWTSSDGVLSVTYAVDGGTFTVSRERVSGVLYAVFRFVPTAVTTPHPIGRRGEAAGPPLSTAASTPPPTP